MTNPLIELHQHGQSFWYDNIRRKFLEDGTLANLIAHDGLRGLTSNPAIFQKAIGESDDYDTHIAQLVAEGATLNEVYEALVIADITAACDLFAALYATSNGGDGFVSLEVSPHLAHDTAGTIAEAQRLFAAVGRPNLMIKVPATPAGIPAIQQLIGEGINVNVTLMFNMAHYEAVAEAYIQGVRQLLASGGDPAKVASVASFFVSRVDSAVDGLLPSGSKLAGQAAVANAKVVYERFQELFGASFAELALAGARPQRLLWASTGTKNPAYADTLYIDELIGPATVNTMPPATMEAFRDHGRVATTLTENVGAAHQLLADLASAGIDLGRVTQQLQDEGVAAFVQSFETLTAAIARKMGV
ncbi:MAG: transaldolase [Chloroflexi bacterium]|nr:transaldolase [Chloroflexota bacterium]